MRHFECGMEKHIVTLLVCIFLKDYNYYLHKFLTFLGMKHTIMCMASSIEDLKG